jgi:hypothetical protein
VANLNISARSGRGTGERWIDAVIVLVVVVLLAILAVAFAISMDHSSHLPKGEDSMDHIVNP